MEDNAANSEALASADRKESMYLGRSVINISSTTFETSTDIRREPYRVVNNWVPGSIQSHTWLTIFRWWAARADRHPQERKSHGALDNIYNEKKSNQDIA